MLNEEEAEEESPLAKVMLELSATVGRLARRMEDEHTRATRALTLAPATTDIYGAAQWGPQPGTQVPAAGPLLLNLGGPEIGRKWIIRALRVSDGGNAAAAVGGVANFYTGQAVPPTVAGLANWVPVPPAGWLWVFPNLPNMTTFTSDARIVQATDNLFCVITGGTVGQNILAAATVKDVDVLAELEYEVT